MISLQSSSAQHPLPDGKVKKGMENHEKGNEQGVAYHIPTSLFYQMQHPTYYGMHQVR